MSYRCHQCHKVVGQGVPQMKRVVEKKPTEKGWEIKKEIKICHECVSPTGGEFLSGGESSSGHKSPSGDKG